MIDRTRAGRIKGGLGALLGLAGLALVAVTPASAAPAPNNCAQSNWTIGVAFLALQSAQNITLMAQPDGSYARDVQARIFCTDNNGTDIGEVTNAKLNIWVNSAKDINVNGQLATNASNPVVVDAPTGIVTMTISSTDPDLLDLANGEWRAHVGTDTTLVAQAFGQDVPIGPSGTSYGPVLIGNIWAQTPELSSVALFGSGAAGMAGYALMRLRAMRGGRR